MTRHDPVVTRFAPSPTCHLHVGGARTALFCWAFARRHGGRFMLRIEDTDAARSSDQSALGIMQDLAWLGIEWDDGPTLDWRGRRIGGDPRDVGPFFQAQRLNLYNAAVERLVTSGLAYPAFESNEQIDAQRRAATAAKQTYRYPRPAEIVRGEFNAPLRARWGRALAAEPHVIRFAAPHEEIVVKDEVLGDVRIAPGELDDFVLRKADALPTYHFAVVVDDQAMGVTHVLRAQEHLANTPRHVALQRALGYRTPMYGHMPIIMNMDGSKMSKRDKAKVARAKVHELLKGGTVTMEDVYRTLGTAEDQPPPPQALPTGTIDTTRLTSRAEVDAFLAKENDSLEMAQRIADRFGVTLPEIEVSDFREAGYVPEALCNYLALLGWNPGLKTPDGKDLEKFGNAFLAEHFSVERIGRTNSKFDRAKLLSFNADAIAALPDDSFRARWAEWLLRPMSPDTHGDAPDPTMKHVADILGKEQGSWLARAIKPRAKTFKHAWDAVSDWLRPDDLDPPRQPSAVAKHLTANGGAGLGVLRDARDRLAAAEPFEPGVLHGVLEQMAQQFGGMGQVAQPIRVAIAGTAVSPPLPETLAVLGKVTVLRRLDRCLAATQT
jgi:glutamyl/glutaminyl-tRNA synthetase